ncbi:molybdopterin-dependent oxidoreductase [Candidatus Sulfurimonas marisnigri]|uniref:Molybdopterin-dependent oxidoreductase n=1 Tax=Candidatus Sulfurimonas marisnigri TaxID=2740405 RepID=A0A7S7LYG1_9BACT|nr:molybdopterin-dependent oxidoreductase [Candidatus Sulfurimonas marisnigri]QOY53770.1 molybdopterin-dependent oxidoreductase [Candidatus Sulfurimonas marisnigri]
MSNITACPLDCYDACEVEYKNEKLSGLKDRHTHGFLCSHLNHYGKYETIVTPRYKGKEITINEALSKLKEIIGAYQKDEILHYRGSGSFALMQEVTDHFFASFGAILTDGSLCDGAGEAGIIEGRGSNKNMPLSEIAKSDVVIFWGRNPHVTSSHLLPLIKDKTIIVIDPIKTKIAKVADLHVQIKPHSDLYLAILLSRFLHIEGGCDTEFLEEFASEYEDYYELTQTIRIKATLDKIDVTLGQIGKILELVRKKKVAIVCGVGVQKYSDGADIMRAIDAFAVMLGLFGKDGCGVSYLGNSKECITSPFNSKSKKVSKVNTEFSNFKTVFIQGANPLSQMPDSLRVKESIGKVENIVYFGLYENETSEVADLVIPAKSFLHKSDIRTSYSHNVMSLMPKVIDSEIGISEYDLSAYLCEEFDIEIQAEEFYIKHFKSFATKNLDGSLHVENREEIPYKDGFNTDDSEFAFLEEYEAKTADDNKFYLITPKSTTSLNSQFKREKSIYIHSSLGFYEDEIISVTSTCGSLKLKVKYNNDLRTDCVLIYSGTKGVNNLTSSQHSFDGKCAIYQENMVELGGY